jgi:hypothetical protein
MTNFQIAFREYADQFINKRTWWDLYEDLRKNANTWDSYSLSIIYLNLLDNVFLSSQELYRNIVNRSNTRLPKYVELMEKIVYSIPGKRPSVQTVLSEIELLSKK